MRAPHDVPAGQVRQAGLKGVDEGVVDGVEGLREDLLRFLVPLRHHDGAQAREAAEARAKAIADGLKAANPEADVAPETLEAALAADAGYQALLESLKQAEAEAEQVRQANMALIREKSTARQREYDALRAKLEAEAKPAQK